MATSEPMRRRHALRALAAGAIGAAAPASWVEALLAESRQQAHAHAAVAAQDWAPAVLSPGQNELVIALTELIIPQTETPGAKAARVNRFVDLVLQQSPAAARDPFVQGLAWVEARSRALFGTGFLDATAAQQTALLTRLSAEGNPDNEARAGRDFFQAIKAMTIGGYYTTEIGLRQELGDPGQLFLPQFQGCDHPEHQG